MDSIASSELSAFLRAAGRAAVEAAVITTLGYLIAGRLWTSAPDKKGILIGMAAAWASTSSSIAWLLWARGRSMRTFWWAFGGGMALRAAVLAALAVWGYGKKDLTFEALLLSYVFALLALLLTLEMRHLKIR